MSPAAPSAIDFQPEQAPMGAAPPTGATSPRSTPTTAPAVTRGAGTTPAPAGGSFDFQPEESAPLAPLDPGGFGPYHESESHLFTSPTNKGVHEGIAIGLGLKSPSEGLGDALADIWDNIGAGAQKSYQRIHKASGGEGESGVSGALGTAIDVGLTPLDMIASGIEGTADLFERGSKEMWAGRQALTNGGSAEAKQQFGRGVGMLLSALGQLAVGGESSDVAESAASKVGKFAEKQASGPGNALLHTPRATLRLGHDPGAYFKTEPVKIPWAMTRLGQFEKLHAENIVNADRLHANVNQLLQSADTVQAITPQGTIARVPNLLDWATEIEDAAEETKAKLKKQEGAPNREKVAAAVDAARDDILSERDLQGKQTGAKPRQATPSEVNELKKNIGGRANYKVITDPDAAEIAAVKDIFFKKAYKKLNDQVDNAVGGNAGERVRDLNRRYSNAIDARELLADQIATEKGTGGMNAMRRTYEWYGLAGGAGGALATGSPWAGAAASIAGLIKLGRTIPGRVIRAKVMAAAPSILPSVGRAAGTAAGAVPAVSGAAQRVLAGEEAQ